MTDRTVDDVSTMQLYVVTFELNTSDRTISRPVVFPAKNGSKPFCLLEMVCFFFPRLTALVLSTSL